MGVCVYIVLQGMGFMSAHWVKDKCLQYFRDPLFESSQLAEYFQLCP